MLIESPCVVSLTWKLMDAQNQLIDELTEPTEFFYGGDDLLPKVEEALAQKTTGDSLNLHLEPEHAFGDYDAELVCFEPRNLFPTELEAGMRFEGLPPGHQTENMPDDVIYTVTEVYPEHVVLDGNHPLAGMALKLSVVVRDVRHASQDELLARSLGTSGLSLGDDGPSSANGMH